jgi:hypothetical protein
LPARSSALDQESAAAVELTLELDQALHRLPRSGLIADGVDPATPTCADGPGRNRTSARSFEGCRSVR